MVVKDFIVSLPLGTLALHVSQTANLHGIFTNIEKLLNNGCLPALLFPHLQSRTKQLNSIIIIVARKSIAHANVVSALILHGNPIPIPIWILQADIWVIR